MDDGPRIQPGHRQIRQVLRIIGPAIVAVGLIFMIIGLVSFFSAFGGHGMPRYFWCAFVGMPLLALGGSLARYGFMGAVAGYQAEEIAPVAKDTFNYMAKGMEGSIRDVAKAVGEGMAGASGRARSESVRCHKCNGLNDVGARFCNQCGAAMGKSKVCPGCGEKNDPDACFCDECGHQFA